MGCAVTREEVATKAAAPSMQMHECAGGADEGLRVAQLEAGAHSEASTKSLVPSPPKGGTQRSGPSSPKISGPTSRPSNRRLPPNGRQTGVPKPKPTDPRPPPAQLTPPTIDEADAKVNETGGTMESSPPSSSPGSIYDPNERRSSFFLVNGKDYFATAEGGDAVAATGGKDRGSISNQQSLPPIVKAAPPDREGASVSMPSNSWSAGDMKQMFSFDIDGLPREGSVEEQEPATTDAPPGGENCSNGADVEGVLPPLVTPHVRGGENPRVQSVTKAEAGSAGRYAHNGASAVSKGNRRRDSIPDNSNGEVEMGGRRKSKGEASRSRSHSEHASLQSSEQLKEPVPGGDVGDSDEVPAVPDSTPKRSASERKRRYVEDKRDAGQSQRNGTSCSPSSVPPQTSSEVPQESNVNKQSRGAPSTKRLDEQRQPSFARDRSNVGEAKRTSAASPAAPSSPLKPVMIRRKSLEPSAIKSERRATEEKSQLAESSKPPERVESSLTKDLVEDFKRSRLETPAVENAVGLWRSHLRLPGPADDNPIELHIRVMEALRLKMRNAVNDEKTRVRAR